MQKNYEPLSLYVQCSFWNFLRILEMMNFTEKQCLKVLYALPGSHL